MTRDDTAELRRLMDAATPAPWSADDEHGLMDGATPAWCVSRMDGEKWLYDIAYTTGTNEEPDAEFIAAARNALPAVLDELEVLRVRLADAERDKVAWRRTAGMAKRKSAELRWEAEQLRTERDAAFLINEQLIERGGDLHKGLVDIVGVIANECVANRASVKDASQEIARLREALMHAEAR